MGGPASRPASRRRPEHDGPFVTFLIVHGPPPPRLRLPRLAKAGELLARDRGIRARGGHDALSRGSRGRSATPRSRAAHVRRSRSGVCSSRAVGVSSELTWRTSRSWQTACRNREEATGKGMAPLPLCAQLRAPGPVPPRDHRDPAAALARTREFERAHGRRRAGAAAGLRRLPRAQGCDLSRRRR